MATTVTPGRRRLTPGRLPAVEDEPAVARARSRRPSRRRSSRTRRPLTKVPLERVQVAQHEVVAHLLDGGVLLGDLAVRQPQRVAPGAGRASSWRRSGNSPKRPVREPPGQARPARGWLRTRRHLASTGERTAARLPGAAAHGVGLGLSGGPSTCVDQALRRIVPSAGDVTSLSARENQAKTRGLLRQGVVPLRRGPGRARSAST